MAQHRIGIVVVSAALVLGATPGPVSASGRCLSAPVAGPIVARFVAPPCPYCAGRRTLDFGAALGDSVRAPVTGRVHFAGDVVGAGFVTVATSRYLVTVGGLDPVSDLGPSVERGQVLGGAVGTVRMSLRRLDVAGTRSYLDPEPFLVRRRVPARLVPLGEVRPRPVRVVLGCRALIDGGASELRPR